MELIMAVIRDSDNDAVSQALIEAGFRVTRIASTGGFLRRGLSTLIIGVSADRVDQAIEIIRQSTAPPWSLACGAPPCLSCLWISTPRSRTQCQAVGTPGVTPRKPPL